MLGEHGLVMNRVFSYPGTIPDINPTFSNHPTSYVSRHVRLPRAAAVDAVVSLSSMMIHTYFSHSRELPTSPPESTGRFLLFTYCLFEG